MELLKLLKDLEEVGDDVSDVEREFAEINSYGLNLKKWFLRRFNQEVSTTGMTTLTDEMLNILFIYWDEIAEAEPKLQVVKDDLLKYYAVYGEKVTFDYNMKRGEMKIVTKGHLLAHKVLESGLKLIETIYTYDIKDEMFKDLCIDLGRLIMRDPIYSTGMVRDGTTVMKQLMHTKETSFNQIIYNEFNFSDFNAKLELIGMRHDNEPPTLLASAHYEELDKKRIDAITKANGILSDDRIKAMRYTDELPLSGDAKRYVYVQVDNHSFFILHAIQ